MSRSHKKNPVHGHVGVTDKPGKRQANKALRRAAKVAVESGAEPPLLREVSDVWDFPKDGKKRVRESDATPEDYRK